jgi:hypothetical protein
LKPEELRDKARDRDRKVDCPYAVNDVDCLLLKDCVEVLSSPRFGSENDAECTETLTDGSKWKRGWVFKDVDRRSRGAWVEDERTRQKIYKYLPMP